MGFITPDLWSEHDKVYSTTSDKKQEHLAKSQMISDSPGDENHEV
jgi:hypothetical protein